jgi:cytochrome c6
LLIKIFLSFITFFIGYSFAFVQQPMPAKDMFDKKCSRCHGKEGTKTLFSTKSLQKSKMDDDAIIQIIQNGKKIMPAYKAKLTIAEIKQLSEFVKTLRK